MKKTKLTKGLYGALVEYYRDKKHAGFHPYICYDVTERRAWESYDYGINSYSIYHRKAVVTLPMYQCHGYGFRDALKLCEQMCKDFDKDYIENPDEYEGLRSV